VDVPLLLIVSTTREFALRSIRNAKLLKKRRTPWKFVGFTDANTHAVLENSAERTRRHTMRVDTLWSAAFVGIVWGAKSVFGKNAK